MANKSLLRESQDLSQTSSESTLINQKIHRKRYNKESILNSVQTGFGDENILIKDPPASKCKTHLFKENYLSEFSSETEKQLVRHNLDLYSKQEVERVIENKVADNTSSFVTLEKVEQLIDELDFVDSTIKSYSDYQIPNTLFKL